MFLVKCVRHARNIDPIIRKTNFYRTSLDRHFQRSSVWHIDKTDDTKPQELKPTREKEIPTLLSRQFEIFREDNAPIILDVEEERRKLSSLSDSTSVPEVKEEPEEEFSGVDLTRGKNGVFDVEQLTELLQSDGAVDLCVISLPMELRYAEHLVIVTGRSARHRLALAQLVRRVFKKKRLSYEAIPRVEGDHVNGTNYDWLAMDLGNIVLHIFARATREKYDLESLWCLGCDHDVQFNKPEDALIELLNSHSVYLGDLEPAEPSLGSSPNTKNPTE